MTARLRPILVLVVSLAVLLGGVAAAQASDLRIPASSPPHNRESGDAASDDHPPVAAFEQRCYYLDCSFEAGQSQDPDGGGLSYVWNFDDPNDHDTLIDGNASMEHIYAVGGNYDVTLTVRDRSGATATTHWLVDAHAKPGSYESTTDTSSWFVRRTAVSGVTLYFASETADDGAIQGRLDSWVVKVNGVTEFSDTMGNGEVAYYRLAKSPIRGTSVVDVYKNKKKVATYRLG